MVTLVPVMVVVMEATVVVVVVVAVVVAVTHLHTVEVEVIPVPYSEDMEIRTYVLVTPICKLYALMFPIDNKQHCNPLLCLDVTCGKMEKF